MKQSLIPSKAKSENSVNPQNACLKLIWKKNNKVQKHREKMNLQSYPGENFQSGLQTHKVPLRGLNGINYCKCTTQSHKYGWCHNMTSSVFVAMCVWCAYVHVHTISWCQNVHVHTPALMLMMSYFHVDKSAQILMMQTFRWQFGAQTK